jgi:large subunit ribosomal protein L7/L12
MSFPSKITELGDTLAKLKPEECRELRTYFKDNLGAEAPDSAPPPPKEEAPVVATQTEFDVWLDGPAAGAAKITTIKVIRDLLGLGLAEAKAFVENPTKAVKEQLPKADADAIAAQLTTAGAKVILK